MLDVAGFLVQYQNNETTKKNTFAFSKHEQLTCGTRLFEPRVEIGCKKQYFENYIRFLLFYKLNLYTNGNHFKT